MKFLPGALALLFAAMPAAEAQTAPPAAPEAVIQMKPWRTRWAMEAEIAGKKDCICSIPVPASRSSRARPPPGPAAPWGRLTGYNMMGNRSQGPHCADSIAITVGGITARPPITGLINMAAGTAQRRARRRHRPEPVRGAHRDLRFRGGHRDDRIGCQPRRASQACAHCASG